MLRLDQSMVERGLAVSRSQAANLIKLGQVKLNGKVASKSGSKVLPNDIITLARNEQFVSKGALKLASVAGKLGLDFKNKVVLDIGSSTGGFTDYALRRGARLVVAVDVGTNQMHPSLRDNPKIKLHEKTDIRTFAKTHKRAKNYHKISDRLFYDNFDMVLVDVSFISLREILPSVSELMSPASLLAAMVKPQFETGAAAKNKGVVKNESIRRKIFKDFEVWAHKGFVIVDKADSSVFGEKGNRERFYLLKKLSS